MKKVVLLSGANGGIGTSILHSLLENGYKVIALDVSNSNISDQNIEFIKCDVTSHKDLENAFNKVKELTPSLFAIVNAVGIFKKAKLLLLFVIPFYENL